MLRIKLTQSYPDRLAYLKLETLELRRFYFDLALIHKIIHGLVDLKCEEYFEFSSRLLQSRANHPYQMRHNDPRKSNAFSCRVVAVWNRLPKKIVAAPTPGSFIKKLKQSDVEQLKFRSKLNS